MSAQEQESRIAQLQSLQNMYNPGQEPVDTAGAVATVSTLPMDQSSDESSSEEE